MTPLAALIAILSSSQALARPPGPAAEPAPVATPKARRADLAQFRTGFPACARAHAPEARAQAEARLTKLEAYRAGPDPGLEAVAEALRVGR